MRHAVQSYTADITRTVDVQRTARVTQLESLFDLPPSQQSALTWHVAMPLNDRAWNIGLIVGPSGSGKSTIARELFGANLVSGYAWPADRSIVDGFPSDMGIKDITTLLSSVGFSSPPSWLRPFHVLSTGQQFRVTMARALAERASLTVMDEFTSVVDRTVAQIGSAAVAKTVRRANQRFIAVTCHADVEDWLQPDWVFRTEDNVFVWRTVQPRPRIELTINRAHHASWRFFAHHHYLTASLHHGAACFLAFYDGKPVAFDAWLPFFGKLKTEQHARRGHRTVCLPDYQGIGIGNALFTFAASLWKGVGLRAFSNTGHPAEIAHRLRRPDLWRMTKAPGLSARGALRDKTTKHATGSMIDITRAYNRLTASFEYIGPALDRVFADRVLASRAIDVTVD